MSNLLVSIPQEFVKWRKGRIKIEDFTTDKFWGDGKKGITLWNFLKDNASGMMYREDGKVFYLRHLIEGDLEK